MLEILLSGESMFTYSKFERRVNPGSGSIDPPFGARAMRVAAVGAGGGSASRLITGGVNRAMAGTGGGCAATIIVPAARIEFVIGEGGDPVQYNSSAGTDPAKSGGDTIAEFLDYVLVGQGGRGGDVNNSSEYSLSGGIGTGGDFSFQGGSALRAYNSGTTYPSSSGGGGAGPNGNGADGQRSQTNSPILTANQGSFTNAGWGDGGGASGVVESTTVGRRGGGTGMGQFVGSEAALSTSVFGRSEGSMGGGGSIKTNIGYHSFQKGGPGGLIVEYFF